MSSIDYNDLFAFFLINFLAVLSPGPDFAITLRTCLSHGKKKGLLTALGITCGAMIHLMYILLGFAKFISQSSLIFLSLKYLGCLYLSYLGIKNILSTPQQHNLLTINEKNKNTVPTNWKVFNLGFLTNLLNPKCIIFFLSLFSVVLEKNDSYLLITIYSIIITITTLSWFTCVVLIFSNRFVRNKFISYLHIINKVIGLFLIIFSIKLVLT